jgi:hypothetical protein
MGCTLTPGCSSLFKMLATLLQPFRTSATLEAGKRTVEQNCAATGRAPAVYANAAACGCTLLLCELCPIPRTGCLPQHVALAC